MGIVLQVGTLAGPHSSHASGRVAGARSPLPPFLSPVLEQRLLEASESGGPNSALTPHVWVPQA